MNMKIDLTHPLTSQSIEALAAMANARSTPQTPSMSYFGHMGTHLDLMGKAFDLESTLTSGKVFDLKDVGREITPADIAMDTIMPGDFVMILTGCLQKYQYPTPDYLNQAHTVLSYDLIEQLVAKKVSFIGIDMAGARKGKEHYEVDQYCADRGTFIIENMENLDLLVQQSEGKKIKVHTYPLNLADATGLPCRVIAELIV